MAKAPKPVKWSIGAEDPGDLDEFLSNDDIVLKNTNKKTKEVAWPGKGPHTFKVVQARVKPNKNGDDRIGVMLVLQSKKGDDAAKWNGYMIWDGFNVVEGTSLKFLKRWLRSLGLTWTDFLKKSKMDDQDPPHLVQIGKVKLEGGAKPATLRATVKVAPADDFNDDEHLEIASYLPLDDEPDEPEDDDDEDEDEEDEVEVVDEDDDDEEDEDEDEDEEDDDEDDDEDEEDEDDEEEELRDELGDLKVPALKKRAARLAKKFDLDADDIPAKKSDLIDFIVEQEINGPPF